MAFPARRLALPLLLTALLTTSACGSSDDGGGTVTGQVSDVDGRLCVLDEDALLDPAADGRARCFSAPADVIAGTSVGDCVLVDYVTREARLPEARSATASTGCPTPA